MTIVAGDGARGLPEHAPFDAINVAAAAAARCRPRSSSSSRPAGGSSPRSPATASERLVFVRRGAGPDGLERTLLDAVRFVPLR